MPEEMYIRPFTPGDVKPVASLYERVVRSGRSMASAGLEAAFDSLFVTSPLVVGEIPPLVLDSPSGLQGFQGRHVRDTEAGHQMVSLGPLFVAPEARSTGAGLKLLSRALQGPQHLTSPMVHRKRLDDCGNVLAVAAPTRIRWNGFYH